MRDRVSCAKVELPHRNLAKGDHISHEQEYNTGHGIPAISHEVRRKIRRQSRQSEIQQEPVVHLLLEATAGMEVRHPLSVSPGGLTAIQTSIRKKNGNSSGTCAAEIQPWA